MDIKELIKKSLQDYHRSKIKIPVKNNRQTFDFNSIKNIALLFFIKGKTDLDMVRSTITKLRKENNNIYPIIYSDVNHNVDIITDRDFFIFNSDNFDYRWRPKLNLKMWLSENNFDLLINMSFEEHPEMAKFYSLISSKFKIANQNPIYSQHNDLTINLKENTFDFNSFYNLAVDNLKMLKIKRN
jgi:hypothetical protein